MTRAFSLAVAAFLAAVPAAAQDALFDGSGRAALEIAAPRGPDVKAVRVRGKALLFVAPEKATGVVVHREAGLALVRVPGASPSDFRDVYLAKTELGASALEAFGAVLHAQRGLAVMQVSASDVPALSAALHESGGACGALVKLDGQEAKASAADPVPLLPLEASLAVVSAAAAKVDAARVKATVDELAAIFTRFHTTPTGKGVAALLAERYRALAKDRADVTVSVFDHGSTTPQPSLIVRVEGRTKPSEVLVLGSHIDSVNWENGSSQRAPGADDNASGTATNLEIFRLLMQEGLAPERTVEIHGYSAEEIGLVGSNDIAGKYVAAGKNVVAMVQFDMNLYKETEADMIWFVSNGNNGGLTAALQKLSERYAGVATGTGILWGGSSDHASWSKKGIATAFPTENPRKYNRRLHTLRDTVEIASWTQAAAFVKLGLGFLGHYGGLQSQRRVASGR